VSAILSAEPSMTVIRRSSRGMVVNRDAGATRCTARRGGVKVTQFDGLDSGAEGRGDRIAHRRLTRPARTADQQQHAILAVPATDFSPWWAYTP
jgi:hypothetical protein